MALNHEGGLSGGRLAVEDEMSDVANAFTLISYTSVGVQNQCDITV